MFDAVDKIRTNIFGKKMISLTISKLITDANKVHISAYQSYLYFQNSEVFQLPTLLSFSD